MKKNSLTKGRGFQLNIKKVRDKGTVEFFKTRTVRVIRRRPFVSFLVSLLILLGLIALGNILTPKPKVEEKPEIIKSVQIYKVGESPKITLQAKIEKSGVIKITSLTPGVIQKN